MIRQVPPRGRRERGAILVQVAVAMLALVAFSALTIDYGIIWMSRRQAQNVADAAALSGAISMAFDAPGDFNRARLAAKTVGEENTVFGLRPTIELGEGDNADITQDISFPDCPESAGGFEERCIRVNVYRNAFRDPLPTFFAKIFDIHAQGIRATATAQWVAGNQIQCLLPFAAIDRWSDSYDDNKDNTYFKTDSITNPGVDGWSPNDHYQPRQGDTYVPPYNGNTNHTGWKTTTDYGRQLIIKAGSLNDKVYSSGWALQVDLPDSTGSKDYNWNIRNCNEQPVGIAKEEEECDAVNEPIGCISIKTGMAQGPTRDGITAVYSYDPGARWDWNADGPNGEGAGGIVGGKGFASPRVRPMVILDIDHYMAQGCSGTTCIGKVANVIGFFVEGMCRDVANRGELDPGMVCPNPTKDVVGRIVTLPSTVAQGAGEVEETASFLQIVRLVR